MVTNKVLVVGHRNPDFDSMVSTVLLSKIFKKNKLNCAPAFFENDIIDEKLKTLLLNYTDANFFNLKENQISNYYYILVDHNDVSQSIKNSRLVVYIADHHQNKFWGDEEEFLFKTCGATAGLIYNYFRDSYDFSEKEKELVALTLALDTNFGKSNKYTEEDKKLFAELSPEKTMHDYFVEFFQESDLSSSDKILNSDKKEIEISGNKYNTFCVSVKTQGKYKDFYNAIKNSDYPYQLGIFHNVKADTTQYVIKTDRILDTGSYDSYISRETIINDIVNEMEIDENTR